MAYATIVFRNPDTRKIRRDPEDKEVPLSKIVKFPGRERRNKGG
jgi:hypothetical protein